MISKGYIGKVKLDTACHPDAIAGFDPYRCWHDDNKIRTKIERSASSEMPAAKHLDG
jgi:hypothetical protein